MPAILSLTEVYEGRGSSLTLAEGQVGALTKSAYKRCWVVEFDPDDETSDPNDAVVAVPVGIGDVYTTAAGGVDFASWCGAVEAQPYKAPWVWLVTASYSSDLDLSNPSGDPLKMPPVFSWGHKTATRPATVCDAEGNAAAQVNSAGDPIDPPITEEETWQTLKISRNILWEDWDPRAAAAFHNAVNDDAWLGYRPGEVLCTGLDCDSEYVKGVVIGKLSGSFEMKPKGSDSWAVQVLDRGFQGFDAAGTKRVFVDQGTGRALTGASLLDGTGKQLARNAAPVYLTFFSKIPQIFAEIGLP